MTIKNIMCFKLTMDHISIDMLFHQITAAIQHTKDRTKTAKLTNMNDLVVGQYMRVLVASRYSRLLTWLIMNSSRPRCWSTMTAHTAANLFSTYACTFATATI